MASPPEAVARSPLTRALAIVTGVASAGFVLTLDRVPVAWSDGILYASVARDLELTGHAVPILTRNTPYAVDHVAFYGPVFFELSAWAFRLFGFSMASARLVGLLGALLAAAGGGLLTAALGGSRTRQWLTAAVLLLTPELGAAATDGRMDALAVGLGLVGLGLLARALMRASPSARLGAAAGTALALAAFTTPRALPFVLAVTVSGATLAWAPRGPRRAMAVAFAAAIAACVVLALAWTTYEHGSPLRWLRYLAFIATREDSDIALLPFAHRFWWAVPWAFLTTAVAVAGALTLAGWTAARRRVERGADTTVLSLLLTAAWINLVLTMGLFNITFGFAVYFAVPLLAVVLAAPPRLTAAHPAAARLFVAALLVGGGGLRAAKYVRLTASWSARDPARLEAFVRDRVPRGSFVVGPEDFYFYAVERTGSEYRSIERVRGAEWTRWVPLFDPTASEQERPPSAATPRFMLWPRDRLEYPLVRRYGCAVGHEVAIYRAPSDNLRLLGPLGWEPGIPGYPTTVLYRLPPECPEPRPATGAPAAEGADR